MSINSNRTPKEKKLARLIILLKYKQYYYRKKWLDLDASISIFKAKINECYELRKTRSTQKKKLGDGYACKTVN